MSLLSAIYASRIAVRLLELGINVRKLNAECAGALFDIERGDRKRTNPAEAAAKFIGIAFDKIGPEAYTLPITPDDMAARALIVMRIWARDGLINPENFKVTEKHLADRLASMGLTLPSIHDGDDPP